MLFLSGMCGNVMGTKHFFYLVTKELQTRITFAEKGDSMETTGKSESIISDAGLRKRL